MKILAFAATNTRQSINKALVSYATEELAKLSDAPLEVELIDLNDYEMPIYSIDREQDSGIPELAQTFFSKIAEADAIVISFAEHNGSYTVAYKNLFDWASRINQKVYQDKPAVLLATSPGPGGAQNVLAGAVGSAPYFALDVKGSLSVPSFYDVFDAEGEGLKDAELSKSLTQALTMLIQ